MKCLVCGGRKKVIALAMSNGRCDAESTDCLTCGGSGVVTKEQRQRIKDGKALRRDRTKRGLSLGEEARRRGISPAEQSAQEWGR